MSIRRLWFRACTTAKLVLLLIGHGVISFSWRWNLAFHVSSRSWPSISRTALSSSPRKEDHHPFTPVPPPPVISLPVWSLAVPSSNVLKTVYTSMNIVTFAIPVSVAPPKLWVVSLYYNTLTKDAFCESRQAILQLLSPRQQHVVPLLGKRSGYEEGYSKREACSKIGFHWIAGNKLTGGTQREVELLPGCAMYIELELKSTSEAGDHVVALCEVKGIRQYDASAEAIVPMTANEDAPSAAMDSRTVLYTAQLREEGIL